MFNTGLSLFLWNLIHISINYMTIFEKIQQYFSKYFFRSEDTEAELAYNLWAGSYDSQPYNLMLALDEELFSGLLNHINIKNKIIADVGCGTGRHWKKILGNEPKKLIGFDVSAEMLKILQQKFPGAETHRLLNNKLQQLENETCDCIISTLTIAHIENAEEAITEWNRVLKPGGQMIITDYHPMVLKKGGRRTFKYGNQIVAVKNYIHTLENLKSIAGQLDLQVLRLTEKSIDESARHYYEKQNALQIFEIWKDMPIIYGMYLIKPDAAL
jgi:ubiquinone/menaquinone biosynthesis C-methylase UbiE